MPYFKTVIKHCKECGELLRLNNSRDMVRKNYCSMSCRSKVIGRAHNMQILWDKCNTPEANLKKAHKLENHPKWIENRNLLKNRPNPEKNQWRTDVFIRDQYTCQSCNLIGGRLQAHHKAPYSVFPKLRDNVGNGITLCESCHKEVHSVFAELFGNIRKYNQGAQIAN